MTAPCAVTSTIVDQQLHASLFMPLKTRHLDVNLIGPGRDLKELVSSSAPCHHCAFESTLFVGQSDFGAGYCGTAGIGDGSPQRGRTSLGANQRSEAKDESGQQSNYTWAKTHTCSFYAQGRYISIVFAQEEKASETPPGT